MKIKRMRVDIYPHEMAIGDDFVNCSVRVDCDDKNYTFQWPVRCDDFTSLFSRLMQRAETEITETVRRAAAGGEGQ